MYPTFLMQVPIKTSTFIYLYIYIYIYIDRERERSSSCHAASIDLPDPPLAPRCYRQLLPGGIQGSILYRYRAVVLASRTAFARQCEGVHRSMSVLSSSLLLQQCPACLVCLTLIFFVIGGSWLYKCCFVGCCFQGLFNIARSILV